MNNFKQLEDQCTKAMRDHLGGIFAEYPIINDDYLLVHFETITGGIHFRFRKDYPTYFSGEVIETEVGFKIMFDEYNDHIDHYFELASLEISEGYLLPNNLDRIED